MFSQNNTLGPPGVCPVPDRPDAADDLSAVPSNLLTFRRRGPLPRPSNIFQLDLEPVDPADGPLDVPHPVPVQ